MFLELKDKDNNYRKEYFDILKYRLAFGSLELEGIDGDLADIRQTINIRNQLRAINLIFENSNTSSFSGFEFTKLLCDIVKEVTGGEIENFRTSKVIVNGSNVERSKPNMIYNDLYYLIDNYNYQLSNCKNEDDIYEAEAQFHIRLLYIHPFLDGNGRTARIFLAYNLMKNDLAPCIITKERKSEYCELIENCDVKSLAHMFKKLSHQELDTMISLYKDLNDRGLIKESLMTPEQEKEYRQKCLKKNNY